MRRYNVFVSAFSIAIGLAIFHFSRNLTSFSEDGIPGEAFWPRAIGSLLIVLGLLLVVQTAAFSSVDQDREVALGSPAVRSGYLGGLIAFIAAVVMQWFGFIIAAALLMPSVMYVMGERRPLVAGLVTAATIAVIWFFFTRVFNVNLPAAVLFE
ncbi:MAG: tripartite tricarboxylate transporter TctB family protein [Methylobacteriaceae bacterium]|jgi:hypothetical protein|nr:tripartite tricarboxylate transporter TctB family protein [Methylobacteriaceae bacterium]